MQHKVTTEDAMGWLFTRTSWAIKQMSRDLLIYEIFLQDPPDVIFGKIKKVSPILHFTSSKNTLEI